MACAMSLITGLLVIVGWRRRRVDLAAQLLDAILAGNRFVVVKDQFGRALQAQASADLAAQKPAGPREGTVGVAAALLVAERRVVDVRLLQIGGDADARERDEADARIVHLAREQGSQLAANLVGHAVWSGAL